MIAPLLDFFKREKLYSILLVLLGISFLLMLFTGKEIRQDTAAYERFRQVEKKFENQVSSSKNFEEFLSRKPHLRVYFGFFSLLITVVFFGGLTLNFLLVFKASLRRRFFLKIPPGFSGWGFSMLVKVVTLFFAAGTLLSYLLGIFRKYLLPGVSLNFFILFHTLVMDSLAFYFIYRELRSRGGVLADLGFRIPERSLWREITVGVGGYLAILPSFIFVLTMLIYVIAFFNYEPPAHPLVNVFLEEEQRAPWILVFSLFLAAVVGPCLEEVFFRGFCYPIFKHYWGTGWGMVVTSALFALIHENVFAFLPIFILGMGLVFLYEKRGALIAPMTLHVIHNSIFMGYFFVAKQVVVSETASFVFFSPFFGIFFSHAFPSFKIQ